MSNPPRSLRRDTRFFISAVTRELGTVRKLVKKGLEDNDHHAVEQDNFHLDYRDLADKLRERIGSCDAVVHIAGHCFGAEPKHRPPDAPRRSYTQLEYDIATELGKPIYVFLTGANFPTDPHAPEPPELRELQEAHRLRLTSTGRDYSRAATAEELDQKVRGLRLKLDDVEAELTRVDQKLEVTGRRLWHWLLLVAVVGVVALGTVGYVGWRQDVERRAQEIERKKQENERIAAEATRKTASTLDQIQREFADRFLQQLLTNKEITAEDARQRALKELPALVKLPLAEIESLIARKIVPRATDPAPSPLEKARTALAKGDYDEVFRAAGEEKRQGRELAMLEGTAALARFRKSPKPEWKERALAAFRRAMALADPTSATEREAWIEAAISAASVLHDLARYAEAEPLLRDCRPLLEANGESDASGIAVVLNNLAALLQATNRPSEAEPLYRRALAIAERSHGPDHPLVATRLSNLALLLQDTDRLSEAEPLMRRALAIDERSLGPDHPNVARDLNTLALLLQNTDRLSEAEPLMRRALAIDERSHGPDHPLVATELNNLASLLQDTNRSSEAEPLYRRALAIAERSHGPDHPLVATELNNLASLLQDTNRSSEAEPLMRRALAIDERSLGPDHPNVARDLNTLALALNATNRLSKAEPLIARVVRVFARFQRSTGHQHPHAQIATANYRELLALRKVAEPEIIERIKAASENADELSPIVPEVERLLGSAKPVADVLSALDRGYKEQGKPAVYFLGPGEPIVPHLQELLRANGDGLATRGFASFRAGAHADAVALYEAALELMDDRPELVSAKLRTRMNRTAAWRELGMVEQSRDELLKLLPELEKRPAEDALMKGRARYHLALCRWRLGERVAAQKTAEESLATYDGAPKAEPVLSVLRGQTEELIGALKEGKAPPPLAAIDAPAAIDAARARYRAREALANLGLDREAAPLLDQILGPARPTKEVFDALDRR